MTKICPKCSYARKASDDCPDWQCPTCGVAYHKVAANGDADLARYRQAKASKSQSQSGLGFITKCLITVVITAICLHSYVNHKNKQKNLANEAISVTQAASPKQGQIQQPAVVLFGTEWCGYCAASRDYFKANGIAFKEYDIEKDHDAYLEFQRLGGKGVPLLKIGDEVIKGYNEEHMRFLLANYHR